MIKKILLLSLWVTLSSAHLSIQKEFSLATASIEMDNKNITVTIGKKSIKLEKPSDYKDILEFAERYNLVEVDDYNFDGYSDIAIISGIGYGGVNIFREYYFYDPKDRNYHKFSKALTNIEVNRQKETLTSNAKVGARFIEAEYKIKGGIPILSWEKELVLENLFVIRAYNEKGKKTETTYEPSSMAIGVEKAYFHSKPNEKNREKGYVVKDDKVEIIGIDNNYAWLKIKYKTNKKSYIKWIKSETVYVPNL